MASLTPNSNEESNEVLCVCQVSESENRPRAMLREVAMGGYDCEFVEVLPKQLQSECSICLQILRDPHLVSCCGHSFCETCIGRVQRNGKPCPLCNEPGFTTMANKALKRTLNGFQVRCLHRELGCEWVGELGKLGLHLNSDPQPERQLEGCPFTSIECIHCKNHMRRHVIAGHQSERCPKRPYTCEYCEEYESTFEDVANHWEECKCYLLPCPNNCNPSGSGIERQNLEHHMKEECPLTVVECDFHCAGCGVKLARKDMSVHMKKESVAHISLLAGENQRLAKQLLERDEKMEQLVQQNTDLRYMIYQQQRAYQEIKKMVDTQGKDIQQQQQQQQQETAKQVQELAWQNSELKKRTEEQQQNFLEQKKAVQQQLENHNALATKVAIQTQGFQWVEGLRLRPQLFPICIKMDAFQELKDENTDWRSFSFYTHRAGYKMSLKISANGEDKGKGTHVSVYTCLMRGEFDSDLKWPFRGVVTVQLLNQLEDREHHTETISYDDKTDEKHAGRVTVGEKSMGWGYGKFIPHEELKFKRTKNRLYLKDDCLIFQVLSITIQ